ncbi:UPF0175 family protein [Candidatus Woesearchaeota archaeon]|nr:UPF0175 family protein [Candidatus Woesearchaeota archaeon]
MYVPKTVRIEKKLLSEVEEIARQLDVDLSTCLRQLIRRGYRQLLIDNALDDYKKAKIGISEAARRAGMNIWDFIEVLKKENIDLNVDLSDWKLGKEI